MARRAKKFILMAYRCEQTFFYGTPVGTIFFFNGIHVKVSNKRVAAQFQDLKPTRQQQLPATEATTVGEVGIRRRRRAAVGAAGV
jgi:hypothetical protein